MKPGTVAAFPGFFPLHIVTYNNTRYHRVEELLLPFAEKTRTNQINEKTSRFQKNLL